MKTRFIIIFVFIANFSFGQVSTSPELPISNQEMTLTVDVSDTDLAGYSEDVWIWTWIKATSGDLDAPTNVNPATDDQSAALMTRSADNEDIYSITFTPTEFFNQPAELFEEIGFLLKGSDWSNGQTGDMSFEVLSDQFEVRITSPTSTSLLVDAGEVIAIEATASESSDFSLLVNDIEVVSATDVTELSYQLTIEDNEGVVTVKATNDSETVSDHFTYLVKVPTVEEQRPVGIVDGINYGEDNSKVTLSMWAPQKSSVYLLGDFNQWTISAGYQMKKDGEHFWLDVSGLETNKEYAYQYLVDETIWVADAYADKILDPDDQWISEDTYPNLMEYPEGALHDNWYENRVAVFQTGQVPYEWKNTSFVKPEKDELVIYEVLVRDVFGEENMNYQTLIDTLDYIQAMNVNAIELMPIMEFNGNDSWGYNPTFMFAVDKAYGSKDDLKEFIDEAHGRGIAVILDMVMNQNDAPSPFAQMYFDIENFKPTADNPWFNEEAKHPYNVFLDINHESSYTQTWLDSINHYWINEFHFDGYRFDLSKGFTQTNSGTDVSSWGAKDDSRITILTRMADKIWEHTPEAYVILEHFADNEEEKILSDYGMMLWGNSHHDFGEANLGFAEEQSVGWAYAYERGWDYNHLVSYMESHDEERQMYKLLEFGNSFESYNIRQEKTALDRLKMSAAIFYNIPGPKLFWMWGEYGYDISIEENGRTGRKPTRWEYLENPYKNNLLEYYKEIIGLKSRYDVFAKGDFEWQPEGVYKTIHLSNKDTAALILANYGMEKMTIDQEFDNTGSWYDFFTGEVLEITNTTTSITFEPGEFHIYTNHKLHDPNIEIVLATNDSSSDVNFSNNFVLYPNPTSGMLNLKNLRTNNLNVKWMVIDLSGKVVLNGVVHQDQIDISELDNGVYLFSVDGINNFRVIKK